ncbi:hypothetical protein [Oerskovia rustica]|uniref:Uncharacterized protein n=1 Tax=Oerskovia rustica TaxID=2762237 RepID=A0ABR8RPD4_9CELL|nr:hypothetical protein [Oerskovia rustica]MBD7949626.1 hypothetical protein [Oerskovia rustica]
MSTATEQKAYSIAGVEAVTPFSQKQIRAAIRATDPAAWPPPLKAKVTSRNADGTPRQYVVLEKDLDAWLENLDTA